ncbi:MAG: sterol desaturase family protein [Gammaproteobacteria bacterium]|nr:sterol desaturase family protein [Gammaproteobacteria bacterium]
MNPIVYAIPVFMVSILLEAWVAHRRGVHAYDIPDAITSLNFGILSQVAGVFLRVVTFGAYIWVFEHLRITTLPVDQWWVWVAALVAYDFIYYWVHRCGHEVNAMWAAHQVHHSSEWFNLSTALRQTSTGAFLSFPFYLPMAIAGVPPLVFGTVALIDLLYQYWVHTELVRKLGWVDRVFVTPSNHRVHHGQNDYCIDRNYGGILILWDRLFGTFAEERDAEPVVYGIRKPLASCNPVWGNLNVYRDVLRKSLLERTGSGALRTWIDPPAGRDAPLPHLDPASVHRYDPNTPRGVRRYVVVQYALLAFAVTHFLAVVPGLEPALRILYALAIVISVLSIGWLLEGRRHAKLFEAARLLGIAAGVALVAPLT